MATVYVQRRAGAITGVYAGAQQGVAEEAIDDAHPDVVAYLNPPPPSVAQRVQKRLAADPILDAIVDDLAVARGVPRAALLAAWAAKLP
jgi:hypothetical protein